jgi:ZIP family zinc transporter
VTDVLTLLGAGAATALACGLGAVPVFLLGQRARGLASLLWGLAAGTMGVASIIGLLVPALHDGSTVVVVVGVALGGGFMLVARAHFERPVPTRTAARARSLVIFAVLAVHSLPEGLAMGTAYASSTAGLGLFVIVAIGLQNIPEGTSVAIPLQAEGASHRRQFWSATASSLPQPLGAVVAYLLVDQVQALLAVSFAFAAGAMLALVTVEMAPAAVEGKRPAQALGGAAAGAALMVGLSTWIGV